MKTIYWNEGNSLGFADVELVGRTRKGDWKYESCLYGWYYIVSKDLTTVTTPSNDTFPVDRIV